MKLGDIFDEIRDTEIEAPDLLKKKILERLREETRHSRLLLFWRTFAIVSTILLISFILYFVFPRQPIKQEDRPPKPNFVVACFSSKINDPCSYTTREGSIIKGKCIMSDIPTGGQELACSIDGKTLQSPPPPPK